MQLLSLLFPLIFITFAHASEQENDRYSARKGILDLSEWNSQLNGNVKLQGEWEFFWNRFLSVEEMQINSAAIPDTFITIPGGWKNYRLNGKKLSRTGHATLRLKIKIDTTCNKQLALKINRWSNPFILYANGLKIAEVGTIALEASREIYDSRPQIVSIPTEDSIDLIMQVSNYTGKKNSCTYPLVLGLHSRLQNQRTSSIASMLILFGAIFVIGFCLLLAFFTIRPYKKALLFLGLSCITISLRSLCMGEAFINDLLPGLPLFLKFKAELSLLYLFVIFINLYGKAIFPDLLKMWLIRLVWISHALFIAVVLLFNYDTALYTQLPHHIIVAFDGSYILIVLGRAVGLKRKGAVIFMTSLAVFFFTAVHDMFVFHGIINSPYIIHFGFLGFIVIQTLLVTYLYTSSTGNLFALTEKLNQTHQELIELKSSFNAEVIHDVTPFCRKFKISEREKDVILLIASGASNNEIAVRMFISFHTVRRHISNIYKKCGVSERNDLLDLIKNHSPESD